MFFDCAKQNKVGQELSAERSKGASFGGRRPEQAFSKGGLFDGLKEAPAEGGSECRIRQSPGQETMAAKLVSGADMPASSFGARVAASAI